MNLELLMEQIKPLNERAMDAARSRQNMLTKPQGSLGKLESLSIQLAGITGQERPKIKNKVVTVMAGDHGVAAEGVSAYPQEVTPQMALNFLAGGAAVNVLARHAGAHVVIVDMGVASDIPANPNLLVKKIGYGTGNIALGAAMTREQAIQSIMAGVEIVEAEIARGADLFATGDMGIANTTPSAAIACVILNRPAREIVGRGTGVDDDGLNRKVKAVESAIAVNHPDENDGLDILAKVGGFEIGGLAGVILASAAHQKPVIVDGFISTAAALIAVKLAPLARDYIITAHRSQELGHQLMMEWLGKEPLLDLDLRLGEGTGAVLAMSIVEASCKVLDEMATFGEAGVSEKE